MGMVRLIKMICAFKKNHFVEALMSSLKVYFEMHGRDRYAFEYEPINKLLCRLMPIYELSDDDFRKLFRLRYGENSLTPKKEQYLQDCIGELQDFASSFIDTLNFKYAILCIKAQQKIASLCRDLNGNLLCWTYITGIDLYARLYDHKKLFEICDEGLKFARDNEDIELEFVILMRKWVQCYLATLQDNSLDIDVVQLDTEEQLLKLYAPYGDNVENFVKSQKDKEMRILEENGPSGIPHYMMRIGWLDDSLAGYNTMVAQGRGDPRTVEYSLNQAKKARKELFGDRKSVV